MSRERNRSEQTLASAIQAPLVKEGLSLPARMRECVDIPRVHIEGDIRLCVPESSVARRPVQGHYHIETEGLREPLQIIWMLEGKVLNYNQRSLDVEFDVSGIPAGETLTRVITVEVIETIGRACIVHSSVFIQIFVERDDLYIQSAVLDTVVS